MLVGQKGDAATLRQEGHDGHQEITDLVNFHEKADGRRGKSDASAEEEGRGERGVADEAHREGASDCSEDRAASRTTEARRDRRVDVTGDDAAR